MGSVFHPTYAAYSCLLFALGADRSVTSKQRWLRLLMSPGKFLSSLKLVDCLERSSLGRSEGNLLRNFLSLEDSFSSLTYMSWCS